MLRQAVANSFQEVHSIDLHQGVGGATRSWYLSHVSALISAQDQVGTVFI